MAKKAVSMDNVNALDRRLSETFSAYEVGPLQYSTASYLIDGTRITVYPKKVVFQGEKAEELASSFGYQLEEEKPTILRFPMAGSDEVGTGDTFGGISVAAVYLEKEDIEDIKRLGITDSKALDDKRILEELGPYIVAHYDYSQLYLSPSDYNRVKGKENMNSIKAKMHDRVLKNLRERHPNAHLYVDQFCLPEKYYSYLDDPIKGIEFSTKGESKFPCVAAASVLARYSFLKHMEKMDEEYGVHFPLGSASHVREFAVSFKEKRPDDLAKVAKADFKNIKDLF